MNTPIVDFVKKYADSNSLRLHMPGHKGESILGCEKYDITEIAGADVLYTASGIIAESQKNASELFDTKATFYSTEGSSLCIRAMLYLVKTYAMQNGKKPIIAAGRNAHKTFISACALLDIDVDWLLPVNAETIISCEINSNFIDQYLSKNEQKPTAVYITSPDYLGNTVDIAAISKVCKKHGILLIVDNAHGAYLKFLPEDKHPISLGADMCCDSAHKTLPVLTGGAYLHIGNNAPLFFLENTQNALSIFASTSPSYLILQSLDAVNEYIANGYKEKLAIFLEKVNGLRARLIKKGYCLYGNEPLKVTILSNPYGYTGYELSRILAQKNIVCEFCDPNYVVFMLSLETSNDIDRFCNALLQIEPREPINACLPAPRLKPCKNSFNQALYAEKEKLPIEKCVGRISGSTDIICPPAIPIVLPGEEIDDSAVRMLKYYGIKEWVVIK